MSENAITSSVGNVTTTMFKPEIKVKKPLNWKVNRTCMKCNEVLVPEEKANVCSECEMKYARY